MPGTEAASLRRGNIVFIEGKYYIVVDYQHIKLGRGGANTKLKLKSIDTGNIIEKTFGSDQIIEKPEVYIKPMSVLYIDEESIHIMDNETYEQYDIPRDIVGEDIVFFKENTEIMGYIHEGKVVSVIPPDFIELEVIETDPGLRGDTVSGGSKPAKLETGLVIQVPLFVQIGDKIKVDTRNKRYVERVK